MEPNQLPQPTKSDNTILENKIKVNPTETHDYSILSDFFPDTAIEQFRESAINPIIALLNAEFVEGGDKAIAELLHAIPNGDKFTNNGVLRSCYQKTYDGIIKDGGISFRGKSIEFSGVTKCLSFKPVTPRLDKEGEPVKYENPPKSVSQVLLPQIDIDTWKDICSRCGVEIPDDVDINRMWQPEEIGSEEWREYHEIDLNKKFVKWLKNSLEVPIIITEGAKKTYSGTSAGYVLAGLGGVWNGCEKIDKDKDIKDDSNYRLITDLRMLAIPGRKFVIAFDKDTKPKTIAHVKMAAKRLANLLTAKGCEVTFANWDGEDGKGIDDLIFNKGVDAFIDAVENSGAEYIYSKPVSEKASDKPESEAKIPSNILAAELAGMIKGQVVFDDKCHQWRVYKSKTWQIQTDEAMCRYFHLLIEEKKGSDKVEGFGYLRSTMNFVRSYLFAEDWKPINTLKFIPFTNGIYDVENEKLLAHDPIFNVTWHLPREYREGVDTKFLMIEKFLETLTSNDEGLKYIIIAFCNAILKGRSDLQKILYLFGSGGNGKGSLMRLLAMLVGHNNTHSTSIQSLCSNRFELANIYEKRLVLCPDEYKQTGGLSALKSLSGEDLISGEKKGKDAFQFKFDGLAVIASNDSIFKSDNSFGLERRLVRVPLEVRIPDSEKRDLTLDFEFDLPAFTSYLLMLDDDWVTRTIRNAGKHAEVERLTKEQQLLDDSVAAFWDDSIVYDVEHPNKYMSKDIYTAYKDYCEDAGLSSKGRNNFIKSLKEMAISKLGHRVSENRSKEGRFFANFRPRDCEDDLNDSLVEKNKSRASVLGEFEKPLFKTALLAPNDTNPLGARDTDGAVLNHENSEQRNPALSNDSQNSTENDIAAPMAESRQEDIELDHPTESEKEF